MDKKKAFLGVLFVFSCLFEATLAANDSTNPGAQAEVPQQISQDISSKKSNIKSASALCFHITTMLMSHLQKDGATDAFNNLESLLKCVQQLQIDIERCNDADQLDTHAKMVLHCKHYLEDVTNNWPHAIEQFQIPTDLTAISSSTLKDEELAQIVVDLKTLSSSTQDIVLGITSWNKFYRKTFGRAIDKSMQHNITSNAVLMSAVGTWLCYRHPGIHCPLLRSIFGYPAGHVKNHNYAFVDTVTGAKKIASNRSPWFPLSDFESFVTAGTVIAYLSGLTSSKLYNDIVTPSTQFIKKWAWWLHCWNWGGQRFENANKEFDKNALVCPINPHLQLNNLIGYQGSDLEAAALEIIDYFKNPELYQNKDINASIGILLHGPPGTGKTHFAKGLTNKLQAETDSKVGYLEVTPDLIDKLGLEYILHLVAKNAPCVVFFDEIDLIGLTRNDKKSLSNFLIEIENILSNQNKPIVVIGAANVTNNIDPAVLRDGRLGKQIYMGYINAEKRYAYVNAYLQNRYIDTSNLNLAKFAHMTHNTGIATLKSILDKAIIAKGEGALLEQKHLDDALCQEYFNIPRSNDMNISSVEELKLAVHIAGHTLVRILLDESTMCATIKPVVPKTEGMETAEAEPVYGHVFPHHKNNIESLSIEELKARCMMHVAGKAAEKVCFESYLSNNSKMCSGTCHHEAFECAKKIALLQHGSDIDHLSKKEQDELFAQAREELRKITEETEKLLTSHKELLAVLHKLLLTKKTITPEEFAYFVEQYVAQKKSSEQKEATSA